MGDDYAAVGVIELSICARSQTYILGASIGIQNFS